MNFTDAAQRLVPTAVKGKVKQLIRRAAPLTANGILNSMYWPLAFQSVSDHKLVWTRSTAATTSPNDPLPIPPPDLRMAYYADDDSDFLGSGQYTSTWLRRIAQQHSINLTHGPALEWGCASGRVLRHFEPEARRAEFWGIDQAGPHIAWCKEHLSPPFKFLTCTAYPHLPFPDNFFSFIYGISIFTHLYHLIDVWLMEFRRILAPGGHAIFTIHDEHTLQYFREVPEDRPNWLDPQDLSPNPTGDLTIFGNGDWDRVFTVFNTDWVRKEWGQYFQIISIEPRAEAYQTAVILQKR
ncbi:MAG TPA: class I SAM-dependent methyltransferase [Tepidisphaeraceae bacterium]|jgi:SAM-dependent methyltransferase|nr:class I SAM-dependent methyltransferase [Tepidisphaeraceae bacterium]